MKGIVIIILEVTSINVSIITLAIIHLVESKTAKICCTVLTEVQTDVIGVTMIKYNRGCNLIYFSLPREHSYHENTAQDDIDIAREVALLHFSVVFFLFPFALMYCIMTAHDIIAGSIGD